MLLLYVFDDHVNPSFKKTNQAIRISKPVAALDVHKKKQMPLELLRTLGGILGALNHEARNELRVA
jgi:hypothetical protein